MINFRERITRALLTGKPLPFVWNDEFAFNLSKHFAQLTAMHGYEVHGFIEGDEGVCVQTIALKREGEDRIECAARVFVSAVNGGMQVYQITYPQDVDYLNFKFDAPYKRFEVAS